MSGELQIPLSTASVTTARPKSKFRPVQAIILPGNYDLFWAEFGVRPRSGDGCRCKWSSAEFQRRRCNLAPNFRYDCGSLVAARCRRALPSPQDISTTSLLTILGAVETQFLRDCSQDSLLQVRCKIANSQLVVPSPPEAHRSVHSNAFTRPRNCL